MQSSLSKTQSRFRDLLKDRETDTKFVRGPMEAYQHAYFARIEESLAEDFPRLKKYLGDEAFCRLVRDYLDRFPSRYANLAEVGQSLPDFFTEDLPLADLARFEWTRCLCSWSEISPAQDFSALAQLSEPAQMNQILLLSPTARFLRLRHRAHSEDFLETGPVSLALFRGPVEIRCLELTPSMETFLASIRERRTLGEMIESQAFELEWLTQWVSQGLISGFMPR